MEGIKAIATVKLTKLDENGNIIEVKEYQEDLTEEEAKKIWDSQQQA